MKIKSELDTMEKDEYIPSASAASVAVEFMKIIDRIFKEFDLGKWNPIETAPKDGSYILVAGDSGYKSTPFRCATAKWSFEKRCWVNHANDRFTDGGPEPLYWLPLPLTPASQ